MVSVTDWRPPRLPVVLLPPYGEDALARGTPSQVRIPSPTSSVPRDPTLDAVSLQRQRHVSQAATGLALGAGEHGSAARGG